MAEYIAKNLAIELMHQSSYLSDGDLLEVNGNLAKARIEAEHAADVVPVVHGEWEDKEVIHKRCIEEWQSARCSACGKYHTTPYMYYFDDFKFCPNCGADMRGEQDDSV